MSLVLALAVPAAVSAGARAEEITPIASLLAHKAEFDRKFCCVSGKTSVLFQKVSRHAHAYFTVWVGEGEAKLKVFGYGKPPFLKGEPIEACGVFSRVKKHSGRVFYDEFSAKTILRGEAIGAGRVVISSSDVTLLPPAQ